MSTVGFLSQWSHALAAILFGALAVWQVQRQVRDPQSLMLLAASMVTALWALLTAMSSHNSVGSQLSEQIRNAAWLFFMYRLWRNGDAAHRPRTVAALYAVIAGVILLAIGLLLIGETAQLSARMAETLYLPSAVIDRKSVV